MNFDFSLDGVAVSTDPEDAQLAGHLKATAESVRDLATYVVGERVQHCYNCNRERACRPLALQDDAGRPQMAHVCARCQQQFVEDRLRMAKERLAAESEGDDAG